MRRQQTIAIETDTPVDSQLPGALRLFETAFEHAAVGVAITNEEGRYLYANPSLCAMLGRTAQELRQIDFLAVTHPDDREQNLSRHRQAFREGLSGYVVDKRYIRKDGQILWVQVSASRIVDELGRPLIIALANDVSAKKQAEQKLLFQTSLLAAETEASLDGVLVVSADGQILLANRRFAQMWGLPDLAVAQQSDAPLLQAVGQKIADPDAFLARVKYLYENRQEIGRDDIVLRDGRVFDRYSAPLFDKNGVYLGRYWSFRDVTDRRKAEELERERIRLQGAVAAMEQVLGVVGHELRTPLAGLMAISEFLLSEGARQTAEFDVFIRSLHDEVHRMSDTVHNLLEAARFNSGRTRWNWSEFDLAEACDSALASVRPLISAGQVSLTFAVEPPAARMNGDSDAIRRLILNLVNNSRKHTTTGEIRVTATLRQQESQTWVEIAVRDTGAGIPPEIVAHLGDAFALNSGMVGANHISGTGLGLSICKSITAAHGGSLRIESAPGAGTTVTARLRADLPAPAERSARIDFAPKKPTPGHVV